MRLYKKRPSCTAEMLVCGDFRSSIRRTSFEAADGSRHLYLSGEQIGYAWKDEEHDQSQVCGNRIKRDFPPVDRHFHQT